MTQGVKSWWSISQGIHGGGRAQQKAALLEAKKLLIECGKYMMLKQAKIA